MAENRAFRGVWIPKEIWCEKTLTTNEKCLLTEIDSLDNEDGCFASNDYFADFFGLSKRQISRLINDLVDKGYITSTIFRNEKNNAVEKRILRINRPPYPEEDTDTPIDKNVHRYRHECPEPVDENVHTPIDKSVHTPIDKCVSYNNTLSNNININNTVNSKRGFVKPTLAEVEDYCFENHYKVDANRFIDYYESNGWCVGKNKMKSWKAAIRNWNRNEKQYSKTDKPITMEDWANL